MKSLYIFIFIVINLLPITSISKSINIQSDCKNNTKNFIKNSNYLLGPGDQLYINFFGYSELSGEFIILNDGKLSLPLVGNIYVTGLNTQEAIDKLEAKYKKELLSPKLDLQIKNSRPLNVSVIGEVRNPGPYKIDNVDKSIDLPRSFKNFPTTPKLVDAIEYAGGLTKDSDLKFVCLKRKFIINSENKYQTKIFNLLSLLQNGEQENNPYLQDEDIILIGKLNKSIKQPIFNNSINQKFINVNVLGEVVNPGAVKVRGNLTILDAIAAAGGIKNFTTNGYGELIRINKNGTNYRKSFKINYENNKKLRSIQIKDGDTIYISKNAFSKTSTVVENLTSPIANILRIFALNNLIMD